MTNFLQYLEFSGKFSKNFPVKVWTSIYIGSISLKNLSRSPSQPPHLEKKNMKKTPQNDKNYQISIRISIKAYFGKTFSWKFLKAYNLLLLSPEKKIELEFGHGLSLFTDVSSGPEMAGFALAEMSYKIENHNSVKTYDILIK